MTTQVTPSRGRKDPELRAQRRRDRFPERMAGARSDSDQVAAAADFVRSALRLVPQNVAQAAAAQAVTYLVELGNELLDRKNRRGKR